MRQTHGSPCSPRIRAKWATWSAMPRARLWAESDWSFAIDTLEVAAMFYEFLGTGLAAELRRRERILGVTADAAAI